MLSHAFKTIFVHIPKTAGQSIERVFLRNHGLDWDSRAPLLLRHNPEPKLGPERLAHLFAREYVDSGYVSGEIYAQYFKFAVVRNPYDRALSEYRYRGRKSGLSFEEFLRDIPAGTYNDKARHMCPQVDFVTGGDGSIIVDKVARYETLNADLDEIFLKIFGCRQDLPYANRSTGPDVSAADMSVEARLVIYERYEADFDVFGYPRHEL